MVEVLSAVPDDRELLLRSLQILLLSEAQLARCQALLEKYHYLGGLQAVGERLHYAVCDRHGGWLGVLVFTAAARRLRPRDQWIGWTDEQRRRRLALVANNARFLLLPEKSVPNLASATLSRVLARLSADWQARYGHPILVVETFVDPERFRGTLYTASGWEELGLTQGCGRRARDFYERHDRPKRLFVRALHPRARRCLQAEQLRPALAGVEAKAPIRCTQNSPELCALLERFRAVPEYRTRVCSYPLYALLAITAAAYLASAPRGQKDLAGFARRLSQAQRRALGVRRDPATGRPPAPSQPTFSRMFKRVSASAIEQVALAHQRQVRGAPPTEELIVLDGKTPKHSGGHDVLTAVTVPSQHYLGGAVVPDKTNEIIAARDLFARIDLDGKTASLDALHTQDQTARELMLEHGADYLFTVKSNQPTVLANIERLVPDPATPFFLPAPTSSGASNPPNATKAAPKPAP